MPVARRVHDYSSQFAFAKRRCPKCDFPNPCYGGTRDGYRYKCKSCATVSSYSRKRHLLKWIFKLTYHSHLFSIPVLRARTRASRLLALHALRGIPEPELRHNIVRMARLWF